MRANSPALRILNCTVIRAQYGVFMTPRGDLVTNHLAEYGAHTRPFVAMALALIGYGDTVLDVGAHVGSFSIPFARAVWPDGAVVAFEPNSYTNELLEINVELNDLDRVIDVETIALSDTEADYGIQTSRTNTGAAHLEPVDQDHPVVTATTLSSWIETAHVENVDFIKIDVEGMEVQVLAGGRDLLDRFKPTLLVEVDERQLDRYGATLDQLQEILLGSGYRLFLHTGARNAESDEFAVEEVDELPRSDELYDVLAIHRESERIGRFLGQALRKSTGQDGEDPHDS